jgi:hypothetical protein
MKRGRRTSRPLPALLALTALTALLALLAGCPSKPPLPPSDPGRGTGSAAGTLDSAWVLQERNAAPLPGYGLYTALLMREPNSNAQRVLTEVFVSTVAAPDAALAPQNLNLIAIPVRDAAAAGAATVGARAAPTVAAAAVLERHYDYGQAALLLASVCRPERGEAVMRACGSATPAGPLLVTSTRPIDPGSTLATQRVLVVNLGGVPQAGLSEVMEAYRRQIRRADFSDQAETAHWRLAVLNVLLNGARLLPSLNKAVAGTGAPP